jgi:type I restriction-modification system DNA methylase subunit
MSTGFIYDRNGISKLVFFMLYLLFTSMALFQNTVLQKYLRELNIEEVRNAYQRYLSNFSNPIKQEYIRQAKEEQYQAGFINDLFVSVLGYTLYPTPNYNIITEHKNEKDSKKADGAILKDDKVRAVIELKGTDTIDLSKVQYQAFSYKNNQKGCDYVITSNFEKLRFYVKDATDHEEFDLFNLTQAEFEKLYLYLHKDQLLKDVPLKLMQSSVVEEQKVTEALYSIYSKFKNSLFNDLVINNTSVDKILLFKKTQKLLDRFLFILFSEDRGLLPPNAVHDIIKDWTTLVELDNYIPLYSRFKKYFGYLNTGYQHRDYEIFAYNGGLFAADILLDDLVISDSILKEGLEDLSQFDFESEVDVNILGHIFEHSLSEIDELHAELQGKTIHKNKTKRKKDGVYYTPKFITKYIVEQTVGALCKSKRDELGIHDNQYVKDVSRKVKRSLNEKLDFYREWLLQLTILDPACGSGAFLNQALEFLILEHRNVDIMRAKLFGDSLILTDLDNEILERNIFGVDINEESVEIARLSLWLRTAKPGRKLTALSSNIKCGNSLIEDESIDREKSFKWDNEFSKVFANGGFDVIIGNPPYGAKLELPNEKLYYKKVYPHSSEGKVDTYKLFFERGFMLLKRGGYFAFVTPNTFLYNVQSRGLRQLLMNDFKITDAVELRKNIFEDAPDVVTVILTLKKDYSKNYTFRSRVAFANVLYNDLDNGEWEIDQEIPDSVIFNDSDLKINLRSNYRFLSIKQKLEVHSRLGDYFFLRQGTKPYGTKEDRQEELLSKVKLDDSWEMAINGRNISRYLIKYDDDYVKGSDQLYSCLPEEIVRGEKIYFQRMRKISLFPRIVAAYDSGKFHGLYTCSVIYGGKEGDLRLKYILCLLNSRLINLWYKYFDTDIEIKLFSVKQVPTPLIPDEDQVCFVEKAEAIMELRVRLNQIVDDFIRMVSVLDPEISRSRKLERWYEYDFSSLLKELSSYGIKYSLSEQMEWLSLFEIEKKRVLEITQKVKLIDREVDQMVYKLFGLTDSEIVFVESIEV